MITEASAVVSVPTRSAAPRLEIAQWLNTDGESLDDLRGRVVVLHAFQMLCPGCVLHGTPLAQRIHERLQAAGVTVIGLHTVFEHHDAMGPTSLAAYLHEFRITMPVGVDRHDDNDPTPATMKAYSMRGTPTLVLIGRDGTVRDHQFGQVDELLIGARIGQLLGEPA